MQLSSVYFTQRLFRHVNALYWFNNCGVIYGSTFEIGLEAYANEISLFHKCILQYKLRLGLFLAPRLAYNWIFLKMVLFIEIH